MKPEEIFTKKKPYENVRLRGAILQERYNTVFAKVESLFLLVSPRLQHVKREKSLQKS